jgi:hypothetical protein
MTRRYDAFLIRRWGFDGGIERIEITHVRSGKRALAPSLDQLTEWMRARMAERGMPQPDESLNPRGPPR